MGNKYLNFYSGFLQRFIEIKKSFKIVFDCSNGTTGFILKKLNWENSKAIILNSKANGDFPAHSPDPLHLGSTSLLKETILGENADLGIIFDADGDRVFFLDNKGRLIPSYLIAYLLFKERKTPFAADILVYKALIKSDLLKESDLILSKIGHYFIKNLMRQREINIAAEFSGHYYFKEAFYADSGILTAINVLNIISSFPYNLADFYDLMAKKVYIKQVNFPDSDLNLLLNKIHKFQKVITKKSFDGMNFDFKDYWVNVRNSNTESFVRISISSFDKNLNEKIYKSLV